MKNHYDTLRINSTASMDEIKHSFRKLAHTYHPDKNQDNELSGKFIEIKEAYDILSNQAERERYDSAFKYYYGGYFYEYEKKETGKATENNRDVQFIFSELKKFNSSGYEKLSMSSVLKHLKICKEKLNFVKQNENIQRDIFSDLSSTIVRNAIDIAEKTLNAHIDLFIISPPDSLKQVPLSIKHELLIKNFKMVIEHTLLPLESFEMNEKTREILNLKNQYYDELIKDFNRKIIEAEKGKGCYIATMVYGDYNNENVLVLRYFRDNILERKPFGKMFINFYYLVSPHITYVLKGKNFANRFIRYLLNVQVRFIRKRYKV